MVSRIRSNRSRVFVNNNELAGVQNLAWDTPKNVQQLNELGNISTKRAMNARSDGGTLKLEGLLGDGASDLFFDFEASGLLSHESFQIASRDDVGERIASGCYLSSYGLSIALGSLMSVTAEYQFDDYSTNETGNIMSLGDSNNEVSIYRTQDITFYGDWDESVSETGVCAQSINVTLPINRTPVRVAGAQTPRFRKINTPIIGTCTIETLKRDVTGINLGPQIDEGGILTVVCQGDSSQKTITMENARLVGLSENLDINDNSMISFNYEFSPSNEVEFLS